MFCCFEAELTLMRFAFSAITLCLVDRECIQPEKNYTTYPKGSLVKQVDEENSGKWPTQVHLENSC